MGAEPGSELPYELNSRSHCISVTTHSPTLSPLTDLLLCRLLSVKAGLRSWSSSLALCGKQLYTSVTQSQKALTPAGSTMAASIPAGPRGGRNTSLGMAGEAAGDVTGEKRHFILVSVPLKLQWPTGNLHWGGDTFRRGLHPGHTGNTPEGLPSFSFKPSRGCPDQSNNFSL